MIVLGPRNRVGPEGPKGPKGSKGNDGSAPEHEWSGTSLRFKNPDDSWGPWVNLVGKKGPKGEKGDRGHGGMTHILEASGGSTSTSGSVVEKKTLAQTISALKLVKILANGKVDLADSVLYGDAQVYGMTLQAGVIDTQVDVLTFGPASDTSFSFIINEPLFLTNNGNFSQVPPSNGHLSKIGYALENGKIFLDVDYIIKLS
jgi:hypothetical protein